MSTGIRPPESAWVPAPASRAIAISVASPAACSAAPPSKASSSPGSGCARASDVKPSPPQASAVLSVAELSRKQRGEQGRPPTRDLCGWSDMETRSLKDGGRDCGPVPTSCPRYALPCHHPKRHSRSKRYIRLRREIGQPTQARRAATPAADSVRIRVSGHQADGPWAAAVAGHPRWRPIPASPATAAGPGIGVGTGCRRARAHCGHTRTPRARGERAVRSNCACARNAHGHLLPSLRRRQDLGPPRRPKIVSEPHTAGLRPTGEPLDQRQGPEG
jgi:hypothetical protein